MKTLTSLPKDRGFFDTYARFVKWLLVAGFLSQIVSAATEIGGINTAVLEALKPLALGVYAAACAGIVALLATAIIEIGLRQALPMGIDAILYRRFDGLHLWMSICIWAIICTLLYASVTISFSNSKTIVENVYPDAEQESTDEADSTRAAALAQAAEAFRTDSALVASNYAGRINSTTAAYDSKIAAKRAELEALEAKERRSGQSFATRKDQHRQAIAELEAEKAAELSSLTTGLASSLYAKSGQRRAAESSADTKYNEAIAEVKAANSAAETKRGQQIQKYGGGMAWFTIACQFLMVVSVIVDRIKRRGAGIEEKIQLDSYDFRPGWFSEWLSYQREKFLYRRYSKIKKKTDLIPAAPNPPMPGVVMDLTKALQDVAYQLQLKSETEEDERILEIPVKEPERQQIGFKRGNTNTNAHMNDAENSCTLYSTPNTNDEHTKHEHETPELREAKQRLKQYLKRLGSQQQKAVAQEKKNGKVCKRTADAVENNKNWVRHYQTLINQLQTPTNDGSGTNTTA